MSKYLRAFTFALILSTITENAILAQNDPFATKTGDAQTAQDSKEASVDKPTATAQENALAPGPLLDKRTQIMQYLKKAEQAGIGVKPYQEAMYQLERDVKEGKTEEQIKPQVDRLVKALAQQVANLKTLKSNAPARSAMPIPKGSSAPAGSASSFPFAGSGIAVESYTAGPKASDLLAGLPSTYQKYLHINGRAVPESVMENLLFDLVNRHRKEAKLSPYRYDSRLAGLARGHARDMAANSYMSHINKQHQGPLERAQAAGYNISVRENIGMAGAGRGTPIGMVLLVDDSLMKSAGHRANILDPKSISGGVGVVYDTKAGGIKVCQVFSPDG